MFWSALFASLHIPSTGSILTYAYKRFEHFIVTVKGKTMACALQFSREVLYEESTIGGSDPMSPGLT